MTLRTRTDPAWLEAQYDNRARVPGHAQHFARWAEASAVVRARSEAARLNLRYGPGEGETLDVFPAAEPGAPVLVFIHGGYWRSLDKDDFSFIAPALNAAGATVVLPNYALCPAVGVEHIALQMTQALAWVWRHVAAAEGAALGGAPARIGLVGHSAGGHLAAMLLSCRWKEVAPELPAQPLTAALSVSGLYDLEPLRHVASVQADLRLTPASVRRLSPAFFPRPKAGKLFAVVGMEESDEFLRQNGLIREVWGPTAVPVCETLPGCNHFSVVEGLADARSRLHHLALRTVGLA